VQRLAPHLVDHGFDDFGIAMADVEDAEPAQAVDVGASGDVAIRVRARIRPFDDRAGVPRIGRLAILQKSGIDVLLERVDRFARDPLRLGGRDLVLLDQG
jgi:hypothetical protein